MAVLAVAAAGAWAGSALITGTVLGMSGAAMGWMAGSMLGNALFAPTQKSQGPKLNDLTVTGSAYGQPIPWIAGHPRVAGQVVWASAKREIATTTEQGKGGGGSEYTSYTYEVDLLILLTDNVIAGVGRIWANGELVRSQDNTKEGLWSRITAYTGAATQLPDPVYEAAVGADNAPAYRGRGSIFIQGLQLGSSGQLPNLTFEVGTTGKNSVLGPLIINPWEIDGEGKPTAYGRLEYALGSYGGGAKYDDYATANAANVSVSHEYVAFTTQQNAVASVFSGGATMGSSDYRWVNYILGYSKTYTKIDYGSSIAEYYCPNLLTYGATVNDGVLYWVDDSSSYGAVIGANGTMVKLIAGGVGVPNPSYPGWVNSNNCTNYPASGGYFPYAIGAKLTPIRAERRPSTANELWSYLSGTFKQLVDPKWAGTPVLLVQQALGPVLPLGHPDYDNATFWADARAAAIANGTLNAAYPTPVTVYEVAADASQFVIVEPEPLPDVASALMLRAGYTASQFDASALSPAKLVRALANGSVSTARTLLEMLASTYQFEAVLSDKIYFRPRGGAPVATLTFDELGVVQDSTNPPDPLPLTQANELEIPAQLALTYNNVDGDYQTDTQYSDRLLTGMESTSAMQLPMGFTASEAKQIVDTMLLDKAVSALSTSITLDTSRAALQPTDVLLITGEDSSSYRMRIVKRTDASGVTTLQCVSDNASVLTQAGTTSGGTASQTTVATLASTSLELMDIPLLRDADNAPGHYVAVKGSNSNWTNCALYDSPDDITFTQAATLSGAAVMGSCTSTLGNWTGGNFADEAHTLTVSVGSGQLYSATHEGMLSNSATNAALVGGEIIQFREAALVSAGVYTLRGLLRGRRGTETAMVGHVANERFVLLAMTGLRFVPRSAADFGRTVYYKAATASQKLSAVASQNLVFQSRNLLPMRPTNVRVNAESADTLVSWDRRTRVAENWLLGSVPLGEPVESWKIEVYAGATLKRTLTSTTASVTYTNAQRYEDFGGAAGSVDFAVYQISTYVGQGDSVTTTTVVPVTTPPVNPSAFISTDLIYPVCKAGSAFIAIRTSFSGSMAQHQLLQSTNGGATLTAVSSASVFLSKKMATARADGVYVSLPQCQVPNSSFKEFEAFSRAGEISIMRGVAGSVARYAASALPLGSDPMGIGCNGSNFYILMEGNHVWKSTDGDTWTDTGAASGFPYTFSSSYAKNIATRNYTASSNLHWTGSAWLFAFSNKLYRTSDADALSGWAEVAWAGAYYYGPAKFVQSGSVILAALYEYNNPSMMRFERSADHGATWSVVWDRQAISPAALPLHLTLAPPIAIDGEFVASTSNGEYRRIYSSANGTVWTIGSNDPNAGWSTYMDQISDGTNVLGYSRGYLEDFVYSTDGMTYLASDTP